jgi:hypothetical protein
MGRKQCFSVQIVMQRRTESNDSQWITVRFGQQNLNLIVEQFGQSGLQNSQIASFAVRMFGQNDGLIAMNSIQNLVM